MGIGDHSAVDGVSDLTYVDVGMYDTPAYGSVYVLDADRPAVIDTGLGARYETILDTMAAVGVAPDDLEAIVPTHVHLDHAGGAGYLARECPNADVYVHEVGAPHLVDPERLVEGTKRAVGNQWEYYADPLPLDPDRIVELTDGDRVDLGDRRLVAHHTPGHAPHHLSFELPDEDAVFVADAAGIYVPARDEVRPTTPPPNFDLEQNLEDVALLRDLEPDTLLYAHYGPAATAEEDAATAGNRDVATAGDRGVATAGDRGAATADDILSTYADTLADWVAAVEAVRENYGSDDAVVAHFQERLVDEMGGLWGERKAREEATLNVSGVLRYLDTRGT